MSTRRPPTPTPSEPPSRTPHPRPPNGWRVHFPEHRRVNSYERQGAFKHRRCLIPSEGFYEWKKTGGAKTPFLIRRADGEPFGMAGLWETWHGKEDEETIESCTIIVTEANALVQELHDRMPVILAPEDYAAWLDPENKDAEGLRTMLRPADPHPWTLVEVSRKVNSPKNDSPELIEPVAA